MSQKPFELSKDDPLVRQFKDGLEAWEQPFAESGAGEDEAPVIRDELLPGGGVLFHFVDAAHVLRAQKLRFADENMAAIDSTTHTSAGGGLKFADLAQNQPALLGAFYERSGQRMFTVVLHRGGEREHLLFRHRFVRHDLGYGGSSFG